MGGVVGGGGVRVSLPVCACFSPSVCVFLSQCVRVSGFGGGGGGGAACISSTIPHLTAVRLPTAVWRWAKGCRDNGGVMFWSMCVCVGGWVVAEGNGVWHCFGHQGGGGQGGHAGVARPSGFTAVTGRHIEAHGSAWWPGAVWTGGDGHDGGGGR